MSIERTGREARLEAATFWRVTSDSLRRAAIEIRTIARRSRSDDEASADFDLADDLDEASTTTYAMYWMLAGIPPNYDVAEESWWLHSGLADLFERCQERQSSCSPGSPPGPGVTFCRSATETAELAAREAEDVEDLVQ